MRMPHYVIAIASICTALTAVAQTQPSNTTMSLPALAKKFAEANQGSFKQASHEDLESLKKLKLPEGITEFYREHSPVGTIYGFVNLLPIAEMVQENLDDLAPGCDVFPHGFVVFATMDGDVYCFDTASAKDPSIVLFGHEEPLNEYRSRSALLREKGKVVASNLTDFLTKCLNENLDREPKY